MACRTEKKRFSSLCKPLDVQPSPCTLTSCSCRSSCSSRFSANARISGWLAGRLTDSATDRPVRLAAQQWAAR